MPYTYLIGWTKLHKYYYGVRWANIDFPEKDLWITYFTSSKYVHEFRTIHGEPDLIQIDETFETANSAIEFEHEFLKRALAEERDKWLNQNIGGYNVIMSVELKNILRQRSLEQFSNPEKAEKHKRACIPHKNTIWINKDFKNKRVTEEEYVLKYSDWNRGRYIIKENAFWNYDKSGENNPFYGKQHSKETKAMISATKRK